MQNNNDNQLTFGEHLELLRRMLFRIIGVTTIFAIFIFIMKDFAWRIILAPSDCNFVTYRFIEKITQWIGFDFQFNDYVVDLIATELSSQFMTHITTSIYLGFLIVSPYILYELFRFVVPALNKDERKYSRLIVVIIFTLFIVGVLMSYFVIFPISFRFLGTYSVAEKVNTMITLSSYITSFISLTLVMGCVFQLPIIIYILAKMEIINAHLLSKYRKYVFLIITVISAIITPPDVMTCILVTIPLYALYEFSIWIVKGVNKNEK